MDEKIISKIVKDKKVKLNDIPDDFDISTLPEDIEIIFEGNFPEQEDSFWED